MSGFSSQIENRNFLAPTGFKFSLTRSPKVAFFCNSANIPELYLGIAVQPTYYKEIPRPGDVIQFGDLSIRFLVDENLENYMEIQNWIRGLGFPEHSREFSDWSEKASINFGKYKNDEPNILSDGVLMIEDSNMVPNFQIFFRGLFPYSLSTLSFDATDTDVQYFTADVSFKYEIYVIEDLEGNRL